eukprot:COSAG04_NODE_446_length_14269_cov_3.546224_4_plen_106_part_00
MRPRLPEKGYLGVLTRHSPGRRPAVSSARVWRNGLLYSAQTWLRMGPNRSPRSDAVVCSLLSEVSISQSLDDAIRTKQLAPMAMAVPRAALELRVLRQSTLYLFN